MKKLQNAPKLSVFLAVLIACVMGSNVFIRTSVQADQFDEKINSLRQQNAGSQQSANQLGAQASSYQDAVNKLQGQINNLQAAISAAQAKAADLTTQIAQKEDELNQQKKILGEDIKVMYIDGQTSTLELLASSKDLSSYVDRQEYRNNVQNKVTDALAKITELKHQLKGQQDTLVQTIHDQQAAEGQLSSQQAQQNQLLAATQSQQDAFTQQIKANNSQIGALRAQQAAANARLFSGANVVLGSACDSAHGDTYPSPWCSSGQDSMLDSWGMYNRECVSYTAWKVAESGRHMPYWGGRGNANQWDDDAAAEGIPVDGNPRAGDVAIKNSQPYGHAMYVESVNGNGTINISQYNANLNGQFSRAYNVSAGGLVFIHFP